MNNAVITVEHLQFAYGDNLVLKEFNFSVTAGQIYGLVGADGAGKSTLLRLCVGQLLPTSGSLQVLGMAPDNPLLRNDIAYMPQGFGLYQDLSVEENLQFFADLHSLPSDTAAGYIQDLLSRTHLNEFRQRRAGQLSGGMMQKLALACALVTKPKVMFLDEPTTGVDPLSRRAFWRLLDEVRSQGVAILYATANLEEAERCDLLSFLESGYISRQGTPEELVLSDTTLIGITGELVRSYRSKVAAIPGVLLAFPVGSQLNVWLDKQVKFTQFQQNLASISASLLAKPLEPRLQDVALRDLALG